MQGCLDAKLKAHLCMTKGCSSQIGAQLVDGICGVCTSLLAPGAPKVVSLIAVCNRSNDQPFRLENNEEYISLKVHDMFPKF